MNDHDDDVQLSSADAAFVDRMRDAYAAPPLTAAQRTRFHARLDERVHARSARRRTWAAAVATAAVLLAVWMGRGGGVRDDVATVGADDDAGDVLFAYATDAGADSDAALPPDYVAIAGLVWSE